MALRAEVAESPLRRLVGLIGRRAWAESDGLLNRPCNSIHTRFIGIRIDAVLAGPGDMVLDVAASRVPWRVGPFAWRARWVPELPTGTIDASATRVDGRLALEEIGE